MDPLFEAKATVESQYALYNIYRLGSDEYRAQLKEDEEGNYPPGAPTELVLKKSDGQWSGDSTEFTELSKTLGAEIDVFNMGYGDILGRIGVDL